MGCLKLLLRKMGLEPTRYCYHKILSLARLPVPTLPHVAAQRKSYSRLATARNILSLLPGSVNNFLYKIWHPDFMLMYTVYHGSNVTSADIPKNAGLHIRRSSHSITPFSNNQYTHTIPVRSIPPSTSRYCLSRHGISYPPHGLAQRLSHCCPYSAPFSD